MTVAELEARRDAILTKLQELDNLLDASEDGTSINVTKKTEAYLKELDAIEAQLRSANIKAGSGVLWLGTCNNSVYGSGNGGYD